MRSEETFETSGLEELEVAWQEEEEEKEERERRRKKRCRRI